MFNSKREIERLNVRIAQLVDERDEARDERDVAVDLNGRLAQQVPDPADQAKAERATQHQINHFRDAYEVAAEAAAIDKRRIHRFARAAARYRAEIGELQVKLADREERLERFEGCDRALIPPPRTGANAVAQLNETRKQLAKKTEQLLALEAQLSILQRANEAGDWKSGRQAAHLQAAS